MGSMGQLATERELLRAVVESLLDGLLTLDEDARILSANAACTRIFGWKPDELIGRSADELLEEGDCHRVQEQIRTYLATGQSKFVGLGKEAIGKRKSGETFPISCSLTEALTEGSRIFVAYVRDISDQRQAEDAIRKHNEELEAKVAARTRELQRSVADLEGFTYSIAHDLRTPLRAINGYAKIAIEDYGDKLGEEGRQLLESTAAGAVRIGRLMDSLLEFARLGSKNPVGAPLDLSALAQAVAARCHPPGTFEIEPGLSCVADEDLIKVVLQNLFQNACKYVEAGRRANVCFGACDGAFFVRDDGIGFDMKWSDKIVQPFQRLHREDEYSGSGIGLSSVLRIVEKHGGRLWCESQPGKGSTFYFTLGEIEAPASS
jgi:PAS domain S-box-containing protein